MLQVNPGNETAFASTEGGYYNCVFYLASRGEKNISVSKLSVNEFFLFFFFWFGVIVCLFCSASISNGSDPGSTQCISYLPCGLKAPHTAFTNKFVGIKLNLNCTCVTYVCLALVQYLHVCDNKPNKCQHKHCLAIAF